MHAVVNHVFHGFSKHFEAEVPWFYLDIKYLVTVAVGNLVDPVQLALGLPFVKRGTSVLATRAEIVADWQNVKRNRQLANCLPNVAKQYTKLDLTKEAMATFVRSKMLNFELALRDDFPWPELCADAQLGLLSMAWAAGPEFDDKFPSFKKAFNAKPRKWPDIIKHSHMNEIIFKGTPQQRINHGLAKRNIQNKRLFEAAQRVEKEKLDTSQLYGLIPELDHLPYQSPTGLILGLGV